MIYLVKAYIQPIDPIKKSDYKKIILEGMYVPKGNRTRTVKIEEQCKAYLLPILQEQNPGINFKFISITVKRYKNEFTVAEDK